jgi:hypothetical protein
LKDSVKITQEVLPKYFDHTKVSTLVRQLNYYGFKKVSSSTRDHHIYSNPSFHKERPDLIKNIHRLKKKPAPDPEPELSRQLSLQNTEEPVIVAQQLMRRLASAYQIIEQLELENNFLRRRRKEIENSRMLMNEEFSNSFHSSENAKFEYVNSMFPGVPRESEFFQLPFENSLQESYESRQTRSRFDYAYFASDEIQRPQTQFQSQMNERKYFSNQDQKTTGRRESFMTFIPEQQENGQIQYNYN